MVPADGGMTPWCTVRAANAASMEPAAPSGCPVTPLVELTGTSVPATLRMTPASITSLSGVDVPWALTYPMSLPVSPASARAARTASSAPLPSGCGDVT